MKLQSFYIEEESDTMRVRIPVKAPCPGTALIRAGFLGYKYLATQNKLESFIFIYSKDGHKVRVTLQTLF